MLFNTYFIYEPSKKGGIWDNALRRYQTNSDSAEKNPIFINVEVEVKNRQSVTGGTLYIHGCDPIPIECDGKIEKVLFIHVDDRTFYFHTSYEGHDIKIDGFKIQETGTIQLPEGNSLYLDHKITIDGNEFFSGKGPVHSRIHHDLYSLTDGVCNNDDARYYFEKTIAAYDRYISKYRNMPELEISSEEKKDAIIQAGIRGEEEVEYQLKWLGKEFTSLRKDVDRIVLNNPLVPEDPQEFDHILISKHAIYLIETKNYKDRIRIKENGNWIRINKNGGQEGTESPVAQVVRHHKVLESVLEKNNVECPIVDIICIANRTAIIEGEENSSVAVVKSDELIRFIENDDKEKTQFIDSPIRGLHLL